MIVWSGWGFLSFVVPIGSMGLVNVLCVHFLPPAYDWLPLLALVLSGCARIVIGRKINPELQPAQHTLFWIRMEYWGVAIVTLSIGTLIAAVIALS